MTTNSSSGEGGYCDEDSEVFEINDFTVITSLESFIVGLEAAMYSWGVEKKSSSNNRFTINKSLIAQCEWDSKSVKVIFGDNNALKLSYYWPKNLERIVEEPRKSISEDPPSSTGNTSNGDYMSNAAKLLLATELDFCPGSIITNQFGVLEFLLLTPFDWSTDKVVNENQLNTILSAVNIALTTTECELPVFVQYGDLDRQLYFGVCQNHSVRTYFDSVHLRRLQSIHSHLSGLIELFVDKVKCSLMDTHTIRVSIQIDYKLQEALDVNSAQAWSSYALIDRMVTPNELFVGNIPRLPFGAESDILEVFNLHAIWPNLRQETLNENDVYSDLDPLTAPFWCASASFQDGTACLMNLALKTLFDTASGREGRLHLSGVLGVGADGNSLSAESALSSITEPRSLSITNPAGLVDEVLAISKNDLTRWINAIFTNGSESSLEDEEMQSPSSRMTPPITNDRKATAPGEAVKEQSPSVEVPKISRLENDDEVDRMKWIYNKCMATLSHSKAAPMDSLASRISTALVYILCYHEGGTTAFAQLWNEVILELRRRWMCGETLPGMDSETIPDLSQSYLQQKLQMLQSCINARARHHKLLDDNVSSSDISMFSPSEEFYDAEEWLSEDDEDESKRSESRSQQESAVENVSESSPPSTNNSQPKGRLNSLAPLCLLNAPDTPIYDFITQERCPVTEDMHEKLENALSSLDSAEARAKMNIDPLLSDMQAFKAANPGCVFEDFVRWHSPRDFVVDEKTGKGCLSSRMNGNNTWQKTWSEALPIPALLQKRLFNETKEAESILQEFSRVTIADIIRLTVPVVLNCAAVQLVEECKPVMSLINESLCETCEKVSRSSRLNQTEDYLDVMRELFIVESIIAKYNSLWSRFVAADENLLTNEALTSELNVFVKKLVKLSKRDPQENLLSGECAGNVRSVAVDGGVDGWLGVAIKRLFLNDVRIQADRDGDDDSKSSSKRRINERKGRSSPEYRMPPYHRRQYVLHWMGAKGGSAPRATANRMYASLSREESRICMALTDDTVFH